MIDRYTKIVLTLIASALLYLCVILTPLPGAHAQTPSRTPGEPSGPTEVIVVGHRNQTPLPVMIHGLVELSQPVRVTGSVTTEPRTDRAQRMILIGWEENAVRDVARTLERLSHNEKFPTQQLPVRMPK
jgi:hypothetical protein